MTSVDRSATLERSATLNRFGLRRLAALALVSAALLIIAAAPAHAAPQAVATDVKVETEGGGFIGTLYATVGGRRRKIADRAIEAWRIDGGRKIAYSSPDGAGGFENEGHALYVYDVRSARRRKVMSEYFAVTELKEARTRRGRTALLVTMGDGGLGASYFAVVDPTRGEVFFRRWARLTGQTGDQISVGIWTDESVWENTAQDGTPTTRPARTERHNLNTLLRRRVIYNPPTNR
jgi:hypothetical protein